MRALYAIALLVVSNATVAANLATTGYIPFVLDDHRVIVAGEVIGGNHARHGARIWVDTGNPDIWITDSLAAELGLSRLGPDMDSPAGKVHLASAPTALVISGLTVDIPKNTKVIVFDEPTVGPGFMADLNVPAMAWAHMDLKVDYAHAKLDISRQSAVVHRGIKVPLQLDPATLVITVPATIDGVTYKASLDIGASYSFIDKRLLQSLLARHPDWPHLTGAVGAANIWGWPGEERATLARIPEIKWGPLELHQLGVGSLPHDRGRLPVPGEFIGVIGGNLLPQSVLEIDYQDSVAYFDRSAYRDGDEMAMVGLTLRPKSNGQYVVLGIAVKNAIATVPGVRPKDKLLSIDGRPVARLTMGAVVRALSGKPGAVKHLVFERNGAVYDTKVPVSTLLPTTVVDPN